MGPIVSVVTPGKNRFDKEAGKDGELAMDATYVGNVDRLNYRNN
jgi:hypothetical protein